MAEDTNQNMADADVDDIEVGDGSELFTDDTDTDVEDVDSADEDEDLDEDEDSEEPEEDAEEEDKPAKKDEKSKTPETSVKKMLEVTHLGKTVKIDPMSEQAIAYIQKGMNYDHVSEQLTEQTKVLAEYGKLNNVSAPDALKMLVQTINAAAVEQEKAEIKKKHPDAPDEIITELATKRAKEKALLLKESADTTAAQHQWEELQKEYPEYSKQEDLPQKVRDAIAAGRNPLLAMKDHEIGELKAQSAIDKAELEAAKQNRKNRDSTLGSAKGTSGKSRKDSFETGLGL